MARRRQDPHQLDLFSTEPAPPKPAAAPRNTVGPAPIDDETARLAARLDPRIRLGTSSWSFPGWVGLVYDRSANESTLARHGLAAYAQHPLFRTVGIDRTFYAPLREADFARYAADVPESFRFLVKAQDAVTSPTLWQRGSGGGRQVSQPSPHFLDAVYASDVVVAPFVTGLGARAGPLVFQFVPMSRSALGDPQRFIERLHGFLDALPRGPLYAVEIRNHELVCREYAEALAATGVCHCFNVHPSMPTLIEQAEQLDVARWPAVIVRWMLNRRWDYEGAQMHYAPFNRLVDEDAASRLAIVELCRRAAIPGVPIYVIVNNKAEGSSPWSVRKLAEAIAADSMVQ